MSDKTEGKRDMMCVRVCVSVCVCVRDTERKREMMCVCERERERERGVWGVGFGAVTDMPHVCEGPRGWVALEGGDSLVHEACRVAGGGGEVQGSRLRM